MPLCFFEEVVSIARFVTNVHFSATGLTKTIYIYLYLDICTIVEVC